MEVKYKNNKMEFTSKNKNYKFLLYYSCLIYLMIISMIFSLSVKLYAQKPSLNKAQEIIPEENEESYRLQNMRVSKETGVPLALYQINYSVHPGDPEDMARQYLQENASLLRIKQDLNDLVHISTRETPGGYHIRFLQYIGEYPVYKSESVVNINRENKVTLVMNGYKPNAKIHDYSQVMSKSQASQLAKDYLNVQGKINYEKSETIVYYSKGETRLVHKVTIVPAETPVGDWEILIDANTGEMFKVVDNALYYNPHLKRKVFPADTVNGTGWVFDPDPLTRSSATYGEPGFADSSDVDSDSLTAQLVEVNLLNITFDGSTYFLEGPNAKIVDMENPLDGIFSQDSSIFHYTRGEDAFEAVNAYYHIDKSMRYLNEALGFNVMSDSGSVRFDPHGLDGHDNSFYLPSTQLIAFGEGGVDDAEDLEVIWHELFHGIHDWITDGNLSNVEGLSEGGSDYWAASYTRNLGFWQPTDSQYYWVFHWDGHNEFWSGRITNYTAHYPEGLVDSTLHTDGQIWSSTLMQIWDDIGRETTDSNLLEAMSMTSSVANQEDAAQAFIQADIDLYNGVHLAVIEARFIERGYNVSSPAPQIDHTPLLDSEDLNGPYIVNATISAAFPLNEVKLIYEVNSMFLNTLNMIETDKGYTASIPGKTLFPTNYHYYIFASDSQGFANTDPVGAPGNFHSFTTGPDVIAPLIIHQPITSVGLTQLPVSITAEVTDNIGVDTVLVEYMINDIPQNAFGLIGDGSTYTGEFGFDTSDVSVGDEIQYRIIARDISSNKNRTIAPDDGYYSFLIENVFTKSVNIPIPDASPAGISDVFTISGSTDVSIVDIDFIFKAQHTWFGDLIVKLTAPDSTEITLIDRPGVPLTPDGNEGNNPDLILDDDAPESIETVTFGDLENVVGTFRPHPYALATFNGKNHVGDWTIHVSDNVAADTGNLTEWGFIFTLEKITVISSKNSSLPKEFALHQNYPNPFNATTTIHYDLKENGKVSLKIYNMLGQEVRTLVNKRQLAGQRSITWDGRNNSGQTVSSGIYIYRIWVSTSSKEAGDFIKSRKMVLLK